VLSSSRLFPQLFNLKTSGSLLQQESKFDPYKDNGGTVVGIAGKDYCIIASDSRLSEKYLIRSRNVSRIFEVRIL
jgi:20S proteasome alpha/beta subunit